MYLIRAAGPPCKFHSKPFRVGGLGGFRVGGLGGFRALWGSIRGPDSGDSGVFFGTDSGRFRVVSGFVPRALWGLIRAPDSCDSGVFWH